MPIIRESYTTKGSKELRVRVFDDLVGPPAAPPMVTIEDKFGNIITLECFSVNSAVVLFSAIGAAVIGATSTLRLE